MIISLFSILPIDIWLIMRINKNYGDPLCECTKYLPVLNYAEKLTPVVKIGIVDNARAIGDGQFKNPWGVAIDLQTDNIYVTDKNNHRVQVFDKQGTFLFKFADKWMRCPRYIAIHGNILYISHCFLSIYDLYGNFISKVGNSKCDKSYFSHPYGIAISDDSLYVCDNADGMVTVFLHHYPFVNRFYVGESPVDIQLTRDYLYVLCAKIPFLSVFNINLNLVKTFINCSNLACPFGFCIDVQGNFIVTTHFDNTVNFINQLGNLFHRLTDEIYKPMAVDLDSKGRLIVVVSHRILIFN